MQHVVTKRKGDIMTNGRDNEPQKRDYEMKNKNDMSWLLPALIGLITVAALAYYLMRRPKAVERPALPVAAESVSTATPTPATPVVPAK